MPNRTLLAAGLLLMTACALAGCGGNDRSAAVSAPVTSTTATTSTGSSSDSPTVEETEAAYTGPTIPEGLWTRHLTRAQAQSTARRQGLSRDVTDEFLGQFRKDLAFSYKIGHEDWGQYSAADGADRELGDFGNFSYDSSGNWVTVSENTDCPGCVLIYRWSVDDSVLKLTAVPGHDEDEISTFVTQGTYRLTP